MSLKDNIELLRNRLVDIDEILSLISEELVEFEKEVRAVEIRESERARVEKNYQNMILELQKLKNKE